MSVVPPILTYPHAASVVVAVPKIEPLAVPAFNTPGISEYLVLGVADPTRMTVSSFSTAEDAANFLISLGFSFVTSTPDTRAQNFSWISSSSNAPDADRKSHPFFDDPPQE